MKATDLQVGDILVEITDTKKAWKKRKGISKLRALLPPSIRVVTKGRYNHAMIVAKYNNKLVIVDPDAPEVVIRDLDFLKGKTCLVIRRHDPVSEKFNEQILRLVGLPYDYFGTLLHQLIFHLTFKRIWLGRRGYKAEEEVYCSEAVLLPEYWEYGLYKDFFKVYPSQLVDITCRTRRNLGEYTF